MNTPRATIPIDEARRQAQFADSYSRLPALLEMAPLMQRRSWLRVLGECWEVCDNISAHLSELEELLCGDCSDMMDAAERAALAELPDKVRVYRGCDWDNQEGWSWSLSRSVAAKFPYLGRYIAAVPLLISGTVARRDIVALKLGREETEVLINPFGLSFTLKRRRLERLPVRDGARIKRALLDAREPGWRKHVATLTGFRISQRAYTAAQS